MTSLIKNQIIKHLSKFARNITPDQISVEILRGKSELKNIELNEDVLTEVLELPSWLRIKSAKCNRVAVKIPWTKLKSAPLQLFIDEIQVQVELTSKPKANVQNPLSGLAASSDSYGFGNKVVEGMSLYVNTLEIHFESGVFGGSLMLSRLSVESRTPAWTTAADLRQTRRDCSARNRTLLFKLVQWQLLRIEASAHAEGTVRSHINAPLRLITSNGRIRITVKKNLTDGAVIHGRLMMILEDILWVATLPQLRSAITFYSHIMKLVKAAQKERAPSMTASKSSFSLAPRDVVCNVPNPTFTPFDIHQTSLHLIVKKIDLHLCDDAAVTSKTYPEGWDIESGAMQVTLTMLSIDIYPRTLAVSPRREWLNYTAPNSVTNWLHELLAQHLINTTKDMDDNNRQRLARVWPQLESQNVVIRVIDMTIQCVSDMNTKRDGLTNLFHSDRNSKKSFPPDQPILHMEFTNFFHPASDSLAVPPPATHLQLGPFYLLFDRRTVRWALYVVHRLSTALEESDAPPMEPIPHSDVRIDLLMPKLVLNLDDKIPDPRLPTRLVVSMSTVSLSNCPLEGMSTGIFTQLSQRLSAFLQKSELPGRDLLRSDILQMNDAATAIGLNEGEQFWLRTSPVWVDTDHGERTPTLPLVADVSFHASFTVNVYLEPRADVQVVVDHFQLLQLMHLSNSFSSFMDLIAADQSFFLSGRPSTAPTVLVLAALHQLNVNLLLTTGPMPSPYETSAYAAIMPDTLSESLSDKASVAGNNTPTNAGTPSMPRAPPMIRQELTDEFPAFPSVDSNNDLASEVASNFDETMSIATSDDEQQFLVLETTANIDDIYGVSASTFLFSRPLGRLFPTTSPLNPSQHDKTSSSFESHRPHHPQPRISGGVPAPVAELISVAEEAVFVDDSIKMDRNHKSLMAKNVNQLRASLEHTLVLVSVHDETTKVTGSANKLFLREFLDRNRREIYDELNAPPQSAKDGPLGDVDQVLFAATVPKDSKITLLNIDVRDLNLNLHDEIIAHLAPLVEDELAVENTVRLAINVKNTDPKKKKPMRLRLKECVIEQDEDDPS